MGTYRLTEDAKDDLIRIYQREIREFGEDIAKSVFHVHAVDRHGSLVWQARLKRSLVH